jgi:hypothetical protein
MLVDARSGAPDQIRRGRAIAPREREAGPFEGYQRTGGESEVERFEDVEVPFRPAEAPVAHGRPGGEPGAADLVTCLAAQELVREIGTEIGGGHARAVEGPAGTEVVGGGRARTAAGGGTEACGDRQVDLRERSGRLLLRQFLRRPGQ